MGDDGIFESLGGGVIAVARGGLANRLKCLISAMRLADRASKSLILYWPLETNELNCRFSDLFENKITEINFSSYNAIMNVIGEDPRFHVVATWRLQILPDDHLPGNFSKNLPYGSGRFIDMEYNRIPMPIRTEFLKYVNKLRPKKDIIDRVEEFSKNFEKNTIGVAIRSWVGKEAQQRGAWFDINDVYRVIDRNPEAKFFVVVDAEGILTKIADKYKDRVIIFPKETSVGDRTSVTGIREALIELLLLSKCKRLKVSYLSAFSEMAWWFGGCTSDLEVIPPKGYIFKVINIGYGSLAFCLFGKWYFKNRISVLPISLRNG